MAPANVFRDVSTVVSSNLSSKHVAVAIHGFLYLKESISAAWSKVGKLKYVKKIVFRA